MGTYISISIVLLTLLVSFSIAGCLGCGSGEPPPESSGDGRKIDFPAIPDKGGPPPFGLFFDLFNRDLVAANGAGLVHLPMVSWSVLMPDGANFDRRKLEQLDYYIRDASDNSLSVLVRLNTGGRTGYGFTEIPNVEDWPVDTMDYSLPPHDGYKNGEWLGKISGVPDSYPPRVLTRDAPGNKSPCYDFAHAVAAWYNGTTPDPKRPGVYLPRISYWALEGEEDLKGYWYGTATELYGGIGGDSDVGTLPTLYRAVHAANPDAVVVGGSLTDGTALGYILHEKMLKKGDYDEELLHYGNDWMRQIVPLQFLNLQDLRTRMDSQESVRIRDFMESLLAANKYYDALGYHMYSTYDYLDDLVRFYRKKMVQYGFNKPLWGTETGIFNYPIASYERQAQRVIKLLTVSLSEGVQHVTYMGMVESYGLPSSVLCAALYSGALVPYRIMNPNSTPEQCNSLFGFVAREGFSFLTHSIQEKEYHFERMIEHGSTRLYTFRSAIGRFTFCVAWSDQGEESFDPRPVLGIPSSAQLDAFDYRGKSRNASSEIVFSPFPIFLEWYE